MADGTAQNKKNYKMLWQGISLLGMLLVPALVMYPGAEAKSNGIMALGYILLVFCMLIPLFLKK
ncbi:MAG TPA: hypothetical protein GXX19_11325 [Syntrophomonadaceae bacterium]|nr:hypothetical protein [Syntrophomonadaceae bacterium]